MSRRLQAMGVEKYKNGFDVTTHQSTLEIPLRWRTPRLVFVNSMSDLFHKSVPSSFIQSVFEVMNKAEQHTFQVLTKRPGRAAQMNNRLHWTPNIWFGTSIESARWMFRLEQLLEVDAHTKFLSLEPLIGPLQDIQLAGVDWVIAGGESGPKARPMQANWVRQIRDNCVDSGVPFFFKQWGGVFKKKTGRTLDGRTWDEMPARRLAV